MDANINFIIKGKGYFIPNNWAALSSYLYIELVKDLIAMAAGEIPPALVRVNYVCRVMGWNVCKIKDESAIENLAWLAERVTFPFLIEYPDNDAALEGMSPDVRALCKRIPPHRLQGVAISRYLDRLPYRYVVDSCFCKQLVPALHIDDEIFPGYTIDTAFNFLTCSLTALQFIEARRLLSCPPEQLPLLAAILYCPGVYSSEVAHKFAIRLSGLPTFQLQAIEFNFRSFVNYLFTHTEFSVLAEGENSRNSVISTGPLESLYALSADGLGDVHTIEQMNLMQYLSILRKKLIDAVLSLHAAKMEITDIQKETGLPINIIRQIL